MGTQQEGKFRHKASLAAEPNWVPRPPPNQRFWTENLNQLFLSAPVIDRICLVLTRPSGMPFKAVIPYYSVFFAHLNNNHSTAVFKLLMRSGSDRA